MSTCEACMPPSLPVPTCHQESAVLPVGSCSGHPSTTVEEFGVEACEPLLRTAVRVEDVVKMKAGPVIGAHTGLPMPAAVS